MQRLYMHDDGYKPATIPTVHAVIHQSLEVAPKMRLISLVALYVGACTSLIVDAQANYLSGLQSLSQRPS